MMTIKFDVAKNIEITSWSFKWISWLLLTHRRWRVTTWRRYASSLWRSRFVTPKWPRQAGPRQASLSVASVERGTAPTLRYVKPSRIKLLINGKLISCFQAQTRSADEPMTTFAYCNECGHRWKVLLIATNLSFSVCYNIILNNFGEVLNRVIWQTFEGHRMFTYDAEHSDHQI